MNPNQYPVLLSDQAVRLSEIEDCRSEEASLSNCCASVMVVCSQPCK